MRFLQCQSVGENMRKVYPASISKWAFQKFHHQLKQPLLVFLKRDSPADWEEGVMWRGNGCPPLWLLGLSVSHWKQQQVPVLQEVYSSPQYRWCIMIILSFIQHCTIQCFNAHILYHKGFVFFKGRTTYTERCGIRSAQLRASRALWVFCPAPLLQVVHFDQPCTRQAPVISSEAQTLNIIQHFFIF